MACAQNFGKNHIQLRSCTKCHDGSPDFLNSVIFPWLRAHPTLVGQTEGTLLGVVREHPSSRSRFAAPMVFQQTERKAPLHNMNNSRENQKQEHAVNTGDLAGERHSATTPPHSPFRPLAVVEKQTRMEMHAGVLAPNSP